MGQFSARKTGQFLARIFRYIRNSVKKSKNTTYLFDYADILCWNNDGEQNIISWGGHIFPYIHTENEGNYDGGQGPCHISSEGCIRLAKAMWWLLARMAGWSGKIVINIPSDYNSIQDGINAAGDGDTILVAPGIYYENILISDEAITLGSFYLTTSDNSYISETVIDGSGYRNVPVIEITNPITAGTSIIGFTIQNGEDGIYPRTPVNIQYNHFTGCIDGIDYESGSGGICASNIFDYNNDDGINLDGALDIVIKDNVIKHNNDDGIEIRLHEYSGPLIKCIIKNNIISDNGEDGIQLIDYPDVSDRIFYIENNLIINSEYVGIGCMANGETMENFEGASIPEQIFLINNTFSGNNYGVTGGDNLLAVNNIIVNCTGTAMKNIDGNSLITYCNAWNNALNFDNCNSDNSSVYSLDPLLDQSFKLMPESPAIDSGDPTMIPPQGGGARIDLGAYEFITQIPLIRSLTNTEEYTGFGPNYTAIKPSSPSVFEVELIDSDPSYITNNNALYIPNTWHINRISGSGDVSFKLYYEDSDWHDNQIADQPTVYQWTGHHWKAIFSKSGTENNLNYLEVLDYGGDFSSFAIAGVGDQSLPVFLISFSTKVNREGILISWETMSEIHNLGFNLYRAEGNRNSIIDDLLFKKINDKLIPGAGNISEKRYYSFQDKNITHKDGYWYQLENLDYNGVLYKSKPIYQANLVSQQFSLYQNHPNPFNPKTVIGYNLGATGGSPLIVDLSIYNILGQKVATLVSERQPAGYHEVEFNGQDLSSGIYLFRIDAGKCHDVKKMVLLK